MNDKPNVSRRRRMLTTAVAAAAAMPLVAFSSVSFAQYRVNTGGALDANNRLGSGGQNPNDSAARAPDTMTGNDIVTGNVTAGRHFRGAVPYTDPRAFRGATAGSGLDNYLRQASGPMPDSRLAEVETRFYGQGRAVAPPPGYVESTLGSGAYVPAPVAVSGITQRPLSDRRGGVIDFQQPYVLPAPGQLLLPGPVDPSAGQQYITASPLTGIRQINANDPNFLGTVSNMQYNPTRAQFDADAIQRMRDELNQAAGLREPGAARAEGLAGPVEEAYDIDAERVLPPAPGAVAVGQDRILPPAPGAVRIEQEPIVEPIARAPNSLETGQSVRQRLLAPPEAQSTVYAQLLRKHQEAAQDRQMSDAEASRAFNAARRAQEAEGQGTGLPGVIPPAPGAPGGVGLGQVPGAPGDVTFAPGAVPIPPPPSQTGGAAAQGTGSDLTGGGKKPAAEEKKPRVAYQPVKVPSLATGVQGKGLSELLKNAENLMKEGKFTSALDEYDKAERVAPNNPLTRLGRANAELGASYYARAEAHLRDVFSQNPELLAGQYDLTNMLGEQRLAVLVKDLKEIANREPREPRPLFLLAYIAYNTGHEQNAEAYLDLADKRAGGKDPLYQLLRENWALPAADGGAAPAPPAPAPQNK